MASFSTADSAGIPTHASLPKPPAPHQLLTCRMVSPVSCASCFFCSSEGYGCCGHQQELPCLQGCHLIPKAWPAPVPEDGDPRLGQGPEKPPHLSFSVLPPGPNRGKRAKL